MKTPDFLPFALPDIGEDEINAVVNVLRSGWITTGPTTKQFERDFADYLGGGVTALAVSSATAGLHLALEAIGIQPNDEVIVPSYTFTSTAGVVHYLGARAVIVDIDPATYNIDPQAILQAITPQTRAIIPVHFAGFACEMNDIFTIAKQHGLRVIEDAAHALPTTYNNQLVGTLQSDATVFSFYATKTITTGEGGMVVSRDEAIIKRCQVMRLHGISKDAFNRYSSTVPAWRYEVIAPGFKYNLTDIAAAIGIQQLARLNYFHARRKELAERYHEALADLPLILPTMAKQGSQHAWHLYPIRLQPHAKMNRDQLIEKMAQAGIGCSVHFIPLHRQPIWGKTYHLSPAQFPHAEAVFQGEVTLPLYTGMSNTDQERVIQTLRQLLTAS